MNIFCPDCSQEQACVPLNENGTTWRCTTCDGIVEVSTHSIMKGDVSTGFFVADEPRRAPTPSETPEFIGRYKVLQTLGQGGFGRVYLAEDAELNRKLAIKVVRLQGGNVEQQRASFFGEARLIARLRHPNIISVFDVGLDPDAGPYIVMELVEGRTLQQRLCDAEPLTYLQTAELVAQVANAIHCAHGQGIVHRDLKPSNILIDRQGAVRVADFGIAISEEAQINHPGDFAGTLSYMPPEQMRGETAFLDGRADIWNIGVILYQLLTGRLPFAAKDRQQIAVAIAHAPKPPRQVDDRIPIELEQITLRCLSVSPRGRYTTAKDIATALLDWRERSSDSSIQPIPAPRQIVSTSPLIVGSVLALAIIYLATAIAFRDRLPAAASTSHEPTPSAGSAGNADVQAVLRPNVWNDVLTRKPSTLVFPYDEHAAYGLLDAEGHKFLISSRSFASFAAGHSTAKSFRLRAEFVKTSHSGYAGVFYGLQRSTNDAGAEVLIHEGINLQWAGDDKFSVNRSTFCVTISPNGTDAATQEVDLVGQSVPNPGFQRCSLELNVQDGALKEVTWNGARLERLRFPDAELVAFAWRPPFRPTVQGDFGVFNAFGDVTFLTLSIQPIERN